MDIQNVKWISMGKVLIAMFLMTAVCLFILALLVQRVVPEDSGIAIGIPAVYVFSCIVGGFLAGKVQKRKKFVWGMLVGLVYAILLFLISLINFSQMDRGIGAILINLLLCMLGGMFGGMLA